MLFVDASLDCWITIRRALEQVGDFEFPDDKEVAFGGLILTFPEKGVVRLFTGKPGAVSNYRWALDKAMALTAPPKSKPINARSHLRDRESG
jgi:hypothetical protein